MYNFILHNAKLRVISVDYSWWIVRNERLGRSGHKLCSAYTEELSELRSHISCQKNHETWEDLRENINVFNW